MRLTGWWHRREETPASELNRSNPIRTGIVVVVLLVLVGIFGFTKYIPFKGGFRLKAVFATAVNIHPKSPVRIAGVTVGSVSSITREGNVGLVTMSLESKALPIHSDATLKIRPRIFLEGNWFVELQPGSPSASTLSAGATIPITQTSDPVQLDQVLDALNTDTRADLQNFLVGYGDGLTRKPDHAEDAEQEPEVRGIDGAQALNKAYERGPSALRGNAIVNQALGGTEPHDISELIASIGKVTGALNVHEQVLSEWIPNFNAFFSEFAAQAPSLGATVARLPGALRNASHGLASLDTSFPGVESFANALVPGVKEGPATIKAALPWIEQVQASLSPGELGGVGTALAESSPTFAKFIGEQPGFYKQSNALSQCLTKLIFPAGNEKIQDGSSTTGEDAYKEFWYALTGVAGLGQSFDGNGPLSRFLIGSGGETVRSAPASVLGSKAKGLRLLAHAPLKPLGTRPAYPSSEPPYEPLVPCDTQALPEFNGPLSSGPADGSEG
jgi:ABC-type transporter Mla subunit MlaD